jgi:membrane protease YdiL (CAAX protease family)
MTGAVAAPTAPGPSVGRAVTAALLMAVGRAAHRRFDNSTVASGGDSLATILGLIGAMVGLPVMYVLIGASRPPVDVSPSPTTALRFSVLLIGPMVAGVVEETAFRGYMQSHLERIGPTFAILMTSAVFTLLHGTHGLAYLLAIAPGFFWRRCSTG